MAPVVTLRPWADDDLPLLHAVNTPEMTRYLGGPEPVDKVEDRHQRYLRSTTSASRMYAVELADTGEPVGIIGFWERESADSTVYETGWHVLSQHQGRGIAGAALHQLIAAAAAEQTHRFLHAYPAVDNGASNALCRKSGFTLLGAQDFEYPPGNTLRCNDWRLDLHAAG